MSQLSNDQFSSTAFDAWLTAQILKLSVDTLYVGVFTCTACAQSKSGEYEIEYQGEMLRYLPEKTYAFLMFVIAQIGKPTIADKSHA
ncbi:hypothetical protein Syn7502_03181 [Synechococcus sp. PCC 7502]|uniref:hypothetical protein n=1 Tax=Synechococcus sp. PCC 7502 TaxID=1173263 RepID=UPI00029FC4BF|nr:hypothetical protein [Synechococcus sp. PCC 7502]AFY75065.1 hypothetical protein Syn7502_03181 [Synechococcus sp. PCC 7502]